MAQKSLRSIGLSTVKKAKIVFRRHFLFSAYGILERTRQFPPLMAACVRGKQVSDKENSDYDTVQICPFRCRRLGRNRRALVDGLLSGEDLTHDEGEALLGFLYLDNCLKPQHPDTTHTI